MATVITLPISAPTGIGATLLAGGNLEENTTYYFVVIAFDYYYYSPNAGVSSRRVFHSPISAEGNFTTDLINKSVRINWVNVSGGHCYQVLLTTVSGDYTNSGGYGAITQENLPITGFNDGVVGLDITDISTSIYVIHSIQIVNNLVSNLNKALGILKVDLSESGITTLDEVYDQIISAGFSDYVYYDGYYFTLKGSFCCDGIVSGSLFISNKSIVLIKGVISLLNPNFIFQLGQWSGDDYGAVYSGACMLDIQNSRTLIAGIYSGVFRSYGSIITFANSVIKKLTENKNTGYYYNGYQAYFGCIIDEVKDCILSGRGRNLTTGYPIKDLKWGEGNNFSGGVKIRLKLYSNNGFWSWSEEYSKFYNCIFIVGQIGGTYGSYQQEVNTRFYDCLFPLGINNQPSLNSVQHMNLKEEYDFQHNFIQHFYNTFKCKVVDYTGNGISDVNINLKDKNGNDVLWVEIDDTFDREVTGNEFSTDRLTNENGEIEYYVKTSQLNLNPNYTGPGSVTYDSMRTDSFPFSLTVSKKGYQIVTMIFDITEKTDWEILLQLPTYADPAPEVKIDEEPTTIALIEVETE